MAETLLLAGLNSGIIGSAGTAVAIGNALPAIGTGLSILSAGSSIIGGGQQAAAYKAQAAQNELAARQAELQRRDQADKIRRSLQATLASQNAAFAARGISLSSGSPVSLGNVSRNEASYDLQVAQFGSGMTAAAERGNAAQNRISAKSAKVAGYGQAATALYKGSLL